MRRRAIGLVRRFFRSLLKDEILQNLKGNGSTQQTMGLSDRSFHSNYLSNVFKVNELKDVGYGGGQKLFIPPTILQAPSWGNQLKPVTSNKDEFTKKKLCSEKIPGVLSRLGVGSKNLLNNPPSAYYSSGEAVLKNCLLSKVQEKSCGSNKITVVGAGAVGIAAAFSILSQKIANHMCLVDTDKNKLYGEVKDIQHGASFMTNLHVRGSTEYEATAGSSVCIVTSGVRQKQGETRLQLIGRNVDILKQIIPPLVKHSPNTVLIIATNPVDILTSITWKLSGLPKGRVFGSGTNLDSSRFRYFISERLGIAPGSCHGLIIGEHGDSCVALWSGVNVAGVRLKDINPCIGEPNDPEKWCEVHRQVIQGAYEVIKLKGYTSWAIGMSLAQLTNAVLNNVRSVHPVSIAVKGYHGIKEDVFLSLPVSLGLNGVNEIIVQQLSENEKCMLNKSAQILYAAQCEVKL